MESLIKATKNHEFPAAILVVISNDTSAPGINLAKNYNIPVEVIDKKNLISLCLKLTPKKYY